LKQAANDEHGRVRLEAIVAASWLEKSDGLAILNEASKYDLDKWIVHAYNASLNRLNGNVVKNKRDDSVVNVDLKGKDLEAYTKGKAIYSRDGFCATCHQMDGNGLPAAGFPPLAKTDWVNGDEKRLIQLTLNGLMGPIEVNGVKYPGNVPMTPFGKMLNDEQIAAVLTYVRKSFGNDASVISADQVKAVREATKDKTGFYSPSEL
jgi:mono/diheme cytochrome c family protein